MSQEKEESVMSEDATSKFKGLLNVEVKAPPVIAGRNATISLLIRNPFPVPICIESIQAPTSSFLMKQRGGRQQGGSSFLGETDIQEHSEVEANRESGTQRSDSKAGKLLSMLDSIKIKEVSFGPLTAHFPEQTSRSINIKAEPNCKLDIKGPLAPTDNLNISAEEGTHINIDLADKHTVSGSEANGEFRIVAPHQEDIASFELQTAHWLMVKPTTLDLYALIKYRVGTDSRSQVIPVFLSIQPPVRSIVLGSIFGGILGFLARQINSGAFAGSLSWPEQLIGVLGVFVMCTIAAIVLSRREVAKGFITLEDFYGAFVVGALIGYLGTDYFGNILEGAAKPGT